MARDKIIQPQLNIVDCVVYALARSRNLPLLFKGRDFSHTDIRSAVPLAV
jgi:ribonuclease VapC